MERDALIQAVKEGAQRRGIADWEIYATAGESFKVNVYKGEVEDYKVNASQGVSLRVLQNGRVGYATTVAMDEDAVTFLLDHAQENASVVETDDPQQIFAGSSSYEKVEGWYPSLAALGADWKIDAARHMEKAAWAVSDRVKSVSASTLQSGSGETRLVNSAGLDLRYEENVLFAYVEAAVADGDVVQTAMAYRCYTDAAQFSAQEIAQEAVERALAKCAAHKIPSGSRKIAMDSEAFCDFLETFCGVFSAENTQKGMSQMAGKEGQAVAAPCVTLMDDPLLEKGLAARPFDDEGVACRTKAVVKDGVLETLLHNLKTAAKQGVTTTGNASKAGLSAPITVSPSNFFVKPGVLGQAELLAQMGEGLLITELEGLHAGANMVSGDFSLAARGFLVEGGRKGAAVEEITVAGNFYQLLRDITAVGADLKFGMPGSGCVGSPTVLISALAISGQ
ncbi:MAG: TldD/PmbA family protein [Eubacteriales bacterium]|nr:TldD/PmbA family protein [Eubacteriales bacterium]